MILRSVRARVVLLFGLLLLAALRFAGHGLDAADQKDLERYQAGVAFLRVLTNHSETLFPESEQRQLQDLLLQLRHATNYWGQAGDSGSAVVKQARRDCADAVARLVTLLDASSLVERVWAGGGGERAEPAIIARTWPYGRGAVLLRVGRQDLPPESIPNFIRSQQDFSNRGATIDIGNAQATYALVFFANAPTGKKQTVLRIKSGRSALAQVLLAAQVPPTGTLSVTVVDETGKLTPSVAGVYGQGNQLIVPDTALSFDNGGFYYTNGRVRQNSQAHYWPGTPQQRRVFFVDGSFSLRLPEGDYRLIAGKGTEYLPASESVSVKAGLSGEGNHAQLV